MKFLFKTLVACVSVFLLTFSPIQAQRFSAVVNISDFNIDNTNAGNTNIDYAGSTSLLLNARYFTKKNWAFRALGLFTSPLFALFSHDCVLT